MSQFVGKELTKELLARLNGEDVTYHLGKVITVVTVDETGWAHPAMLSYHEVVAKDPSTIDLAIGKTSTTAKNLRRSGKITLLVTDTGVNYYLKGGARQIEEAMEGVPFMSLFRMEMTQLLEDQEPDAAITSGVTFARPQRSGVSEIVAKVFERVRRGA